MAHGKDSRHNEGVDEKGARGGDTGKTNQQGKGPMAEKGDQRREEHQHSGPTRNSPGARNNDS